MVFYDSGVIYGLPHVFANKDKWCRHLHLELSNQNHNNDRGNSFKASYRIDNIIGFCTALLVTWLQIHSL